MIIAQFALRVGGACAWLCLATSQLAAAPYGQPFNEIKPLLPQAKALATQWNDDARLVRVTVESEADGYFDPQALQSLDNLLGRRILAYFHSNDAEKQIIYALDGTTGQWEDAGEADAIPQAIFAAIPDNCLDWKAVVASLGKGPFGARPNSADFGFYGDLRGRWNAADGKWGAEWTVFADGDDVKDDPLGAPMTVTDAAAWTKASRNDALSGAGFGYGNRYDDVIVDLTDLGPAPDPASNPLEVGVTPDGNHWYYIAGGKFEDEAIYRADKDKPIRVIIDGVFSEGYMIVDRLTTSELGGHLAYAAYRNGHWYIVHDGREYPVGEYEGVPNVEHQSIRSLTLSPDGRHWACVVTQPRTEQPWGWHIADQIYIDGAPFQKPFRITPGPGASKNRQMAMYLRGGVESTACTPDGKRWAFVFEGAGEATVIIQGLAASPKMHEVDPGSLRFTPDGRDCLYLDSDGDKSTLYRNLQAIAEFDGSATILDVSPDGSRVGVKVESDAGDSIQVVGGQATPTYGPVKYAVDFSLGPHGKDFAALGFFDPGVELMFNGKGVRKADSITTPRFAPSGKLVYGVEPENQRAILVEGGSETTTDYDRFQQIMFTPAGQVAYVGERSGAAAGERAALVFDGRVHEQARDFFSIAFFPDGKSAAYEVMREDDGPWIAHYAGKDLAMSPVLSRLGKQTLRDHPVVVDNPHLVHFMALVPPYEGQSPDSSEAVTTVCLARAHPLDHPPAEVEAAK